METHGRVWLLQSVTLVRTLNGGVQRVTTGTWSGVLKKGQPMHKVERT